MRTLGDPRSTTVPHELLATAAVIATAGSPRILSNAAKHVTAGGAVSMTLATRRQLEFIGSFEDRMRDELLNGAFFCTLATHPT